MKRLMFLLAALTLALVVAVPSVWADTSVTLAWDANSESDLAGYRLFQRLDGQSYDYSAPAATTESGTETATVVVSDGTYSYVLRAFDTSGNESGNSNEVTGTFPIDTTPPQEPGGLKFVVTNTTTTTIVIESN